MGSSSVQRSTAHAQTVLSIRLCTSASLYGQPSISARRSQSSDLTRKRKIDSNPPVGQKRPRGQGSSEPKSVSAKDRVNEFPDECLTVSILLDIYAVSRGGKLFCSACRE